MKNTYDNYGRLSGSITDNIEVGDYVEYLDSKSSFVGHSKVRVFIALRGFWDGEKVVFDDKERTTVRAKPWLRLLVKNLRNVIK